MSDDTPTTVPSRPPSYRPSAPKVPSSKPPRAYPKTLGLCFAADPFDPKFIRDSIGRELTSLGTVVNTWYWIKLHPNDFGPAAGPILASCEQVMERECMSTLEGLLRHVNANNNHA